MGVPKFFRWLSERYPKVIQRYGSRVNEETYREHFGGSDDKKDDDDKKNGDNKENKESSSVLDEIPPPDPLSECGLAPMVDRLYIDFNGILHGCSHKNNDEEESSEGMNHGITHEEIFRNVCYYLDRIVSDVAKPDELVYIAIDGVAPRAKLNQQRSRRYRSGKEGEIEQTVYDAHMAEREKREAAMSLLSKDSDGEDAIGTQQYRDSHARSTQDGSSSKIKEFEPGRFTGKFETAVADSEVDNDLPYHHNVDRRDDDSTSFSSSTQKEGFHSNAITPGTEFFQECTDHLEAYVKGKMANDPAWKKLTVVFSGPNCPGEGEHKIMQFMREQQQLSDYNPNLRHCIMGQDGDLVMLALATHEPNLFLLREQVIFTEKRREVIDALAEKHGVGVYMHNPNFELLHMNILRDYMAYEFETANVDDTSQFDLERTIDDFVFLTFIVGNDFLPHMPAMDIGDEAFDLIFYTYRDKRNGWLRELNQRQTDLQPYLTESGSIVSGKRLESFFMALGRHENKYYDYKRGSEDPEASRRIEAKFGRVTTPSDDVLASKEAEDRKNFLEMMKSSLVEHQGNGDSAEKKHVKSGFKPVLSAEFELKDAEDAESVSAKIGQLLQASVVKEGGVDGAMDAPIDVQDLKGRYYHDKFGFTPFDAEKHQELRKAYVEGLVWNLKYYYEGCVSWSWFYKFHYAPMLSDLVGLEELLEEVSFENKLGSPLKPFLQLMACLPPSHAGLLPEPFRPLMTEPSSSIAEFFPQSFVVDMNGKQWPWEATVLLPFLDSEKLLEAAETVDDSRLSETEIARNQFSDSCVFTHDTDLNTVVSQPFKSSKWYVEHSRGAPRFLPKLRPGVEVPLNGLPTLRDGLVRSLWRKSLFIDVHGSRSKYVTACLELAYVPEALPVGAVAKALIGNIVYINYPHCLEALVTGVSDAKHVYRGNEPGREWSSIEEDGRDVRLTHIVRGYVKGEKTTGTGGIIIGQDEYIEEEDCSILLYVRPFKRLETLDDGTVAKTYAEFELEVPFFVTAWMPHRMDRRLLNVPMRLENNPYFTSGKIPLNFPHWLREKEEARVRQNAEKETPTIRPERLPRMPPMRRRGIRGMATLSDTEFLLQNSVDVKVLPKRSYSTALASVRYDRHFSNWSLEKKASWNSKALSGKVRSPRGLVVAAGLVAACSFLSGTGASRFSGVCVPFNGIDSPHVNIWQNGLLNPIKEPHTQQVLSQGGHACETPPLEFAHGTTTLSFTFQGGIVAAVDSRASLGSFVGSKTTQKVLPINSHILGTMAGGAADCSFWIRRLRSDAALYQLANDNKRMSVARASRVLSNYLYEYRRLDLSIGTMIMGFDVDYQSNITVGGSEESTPRIFYCDSSGMRIEGDLFAVGSGSTFALGILDTQRRFDMTTEEAVALGIKAIRHATFRDAHSGGFINVFLITQKEGWKRVYSEDLARLAPAFVQARTV